MKIICNILQAQTEQRPIIEHDSREHMLQYLLQNKAVSIINILGMIVFGLILLLSLLKENLNGYAAYLEDYTVDRKSGSEWNNWYIFCAAWFIGYLVSFIMQVSMSTKADLTTSDIASLEKNNTTGMKTLKYIAYAVLPPVTIVNQIIALVNRNKIQKEDIERVKDKNINITYTQTKETPAPAATKTIIEPSN